MSIIDIALVGVQVLLGIAMVGAGAAKLAGQDSQVEDFERFGYPQWFRVVTGVLELFAGLGLFAAILLTNPFAVAGAALAAVVLSGAIATHIRAGDPLPNIVPAVVLWSLAIVTIWGTVSA